MSLREIETDKSGARAAATRRMELYRRESEGTSPGSTKGRGDIYFPGRVNRRDNGNKGKATSEPPSERERKEEERRGEYATLLLMPPRPRPRPHPWPFLRPVTHPSRRDGKPREAAAQPRGRRGALCVSENVALIGGSVAVMRYQPPANKRINVKRWRR